MAEPQKSQLYECKVKNNRLKPEEVKLLLDDNSYDPEMSEINMEMIPVISEIVTLGPKNHEHPTVIQFFNWLMDPQRTGEEIFYVIWPLQQHVIDIMLEHFEDYVYDDGYSIYLGSVVAEALALKCPVLEGYWEYVAWLLKPITNCSVTMGPSGPKTQTST